MDNMINVEGYTAPSGEQWILVQAGSRRAWVPHREFHGAGKEAIERLRHQKLIIIGQARVKALVDQVAKLSNFPSRELIEKVGWNGRHFALPDGTVFSPGDTDLEEVLFDRINGRCSERGKLIRWKSSVAKLLEGQAIAIFVLCLAFAASILRLTPRVGNFGFELVSGKGTGKSTFQQIMSSVLGGAIQGDDGHYWTSFDATPGGLEQAMASHSDLPMILEEANLFIAGESPRVRGEYFKALAFRYAGGSKKARLGDTSAEEFRFVYLTSSNEPIAELIGRNSEAALAAADRLITISVPPDRPHGLFDSIPKGFANGSEFAKALIAAADQNHGCAIRRFLQRLVDARAKDEDGLKAQIAKLVAEFCEKADVDPDDGSAVRVAEAFGIVYAAGELARGFYALPKSMRCGPAVLNCYHLHLAKDTNLETFSALLTDIVKRDDVLHLDKRKISQVDASSIAEAPAFTRKRGVSRELWIRPQKIKALIAHWDLLEKRPSISAILKGDGRHKTVKRPVGPGGKQERVYCFDLPEEE